MSKFQTNKIKIKKSGSTMTSAISQLVYIPNFRAIGQSVWEKNGNIHTDTQKHTQTDRLEFYKDRCLVISVWMLHIDLILFAWLYILHNISWVSLYGRGGENLINLSLISIVHIELMMGKIVSSDWVEVTSCEFWLGGGDFIWVLIGWRWLHMSSDWVEVTSYEFWLAGCCL